MVINVREYKKGKRKFPMFALSNTPKTRKSNLFLIVNVHIVAHTTLFLGLTIIVKLII